MLSCFSSYFYFCLPFPEDKMELVLYLVHQSSLDYGISLVGLAVGLGVLENIG